MAEKTKKEMEIRGRKKEERRDIKRCCSDIGIASYSEDERDGRNTTSLVGSSAGC